jgi:glycosyltransferase involved in cell wall biosynthesis
MLISLLAPTDTAPVVTVAIPFLNEEQFLASAVQCVTAQTATSWELLLVDDGSTDGSPAIADRLAASAPGRIHVLRHPNGENRGLPESRNLAIHHARGEFLCFLDADDLWSPNKVAVQLAMFAANPRAVMVCGTSRHQPASSAQAAVDVPVCRRAPRLLGRGQFARMRMRGTVTTPPPSDPMYRVNALRAVGGVPTGGTFAEDQRMFVALSLAGPIYVDDRQLTTYTLRDDSISGVSRYDGLEQVRIHREFERWVVVFCRRAGLHGYAVIAALTHRRIVRGTTRRLRLLRRR